MNRLMFFTPVAEIPPKWLGIQLMQLKLALHSLATRFNTETVCLT